ncbi:conjugal transfer protein TraB [Nitratireductor sp. CAU 1489]|uniref:Conjugal transfer protein TraB n=1 Tax=Nitratireductor arenosus TaxID=2682096 RepID=A0A844QKY1_9HYPH|nr:conjugal transfer protein TraB [Nitratireductor arenosus]
MIQDILGRFRPPASLASHGKSSPSRRSLLHAALFVAGGVITGAFGWSGHPLAFAVGIAFPALWAFAPSRTVAGLVALAHFLGASRGLPVGASIFFGAQLAIGLGLWLAASLMFVAVHAALWTSRGGWRRPVRYATAAVLMSVPPFGIVGWAHPITAAGVLFPGWAWFGLAATAALLLAMTTRIWPIAAGVAALAFAWSASSWTPPVEPEGWRGIDTRFRFEQPGQYADYRQQVSTIRLVGAAAGDGARVAILPESAVGLWSATTERLWTRELSSLDIMVNGGAAIVDPVGYDNVMIGVSGKGAEILYSERMPVPVSMWQPWTTGGAHARFFANPVFEFAGLKVAPLICYEQLIIWPVIQSMLHAPDVIVATGNAWWTGNTNIVAIQRSSAQAWASLFGLPLVMAFNE